MREERCAFLSLGEWDYIQTMLVKYGKGYGYHLSKKLDEQLGGKHPKNYSW